MRCALVIPTRNAGAHLDRLLPALAAQRRQPDSILVVDSRSSDDTVERFRAFGARVEVIEPASFNHGGTRRWASQQVEADALIYLTQDAIPASPDSFANLLDELYAEADIGVAYGRQLPHPGAGLLGAQARRFNYPPESRSKRLADASELGIKTCFSSDSFSAYRSDALAAVGGFPEDVIGSEDAYVAARLLQAGYAVRYAASAEVYHSHDYRLLEEFRRYSAASACFQATGSEHHDLQEVLPHETHPPHARHARPGRMQHPRTDSRTGQRHRGQRQACPGRTRQATAGDGAGARRGHPADRPRCR